MMDKKIDSKNTINLNSNRGTDPKALEMQIVKNKIDNTQVKKVDTSNINGTSSKDYYVIDQAAAPPASWWGSYSVIPSGLGP